MDKREARMQKAAFYFAYALCIVFAPLVVITADLFVTAMFVFISIVSWDISHALLLHFGMSPAVTFWAPLVLVALIYYVPAWFVLWHVAPNVIKIDEDKKN